MIRTALCTIALLLLAAPLHANDGAPPRNFQALVDGPNVTVTVELTNTGEPADVDLLRGDAALTRLEFDVDAATSTWLVCRDWGYDTDCTANPDECSDCDGDGVNECSDPECDIWGVFEYVDSCVPAHADGTTHTYSLNGKGFDDSLDAEVELVDACQEEIVDEPADDDDAGDDDDAPARACSTGGADPLPATALGLLMFALGGLGLLLDRRRGA